VDVLLLVGVVQCCCHTAGGLLQQQEVLASAANTDAAPQHGDLLRVAGLAANGRDLKGYVGGLSEGCALAET
jgi:hypothetical protein